VVKGIVLNSSTRARAVLNTCKSVLERNRLIPAQPLLKQPSLVFKVR
jgi:hypothetical protein